MEIRRVLRILFCAAAMVLLILAGIELRARMRDAHTIDTVRVAVAEQNEDTKDASDWSALYARWPGLFAWLEWPEIASVPVMQGTDNSFYLSHAANGTQSKAGTPFLDCRLSEEDSVWLLYGHNMKNSEVFSLLPPLAAEELARNAPPLQFVKEQGTMEFALFAAFTVDEADPEAWDYGTDAKDGALFLNKARNCALYWLREPASNAQILALSTCCSTGKNGRLVLLLCQQKSME